MQSLNLPRFFTHLNGEKKSAEISKLATFLTELSRSCIVLALKGKRGLLLLLSNQEQNKIQIEQECNCSLNFLWDFLYCYAERF